MRRSSLAWVFVWLFFCLPMTGCDTNDTLDRQRLEMLKAEEKGLRELNDFLGSRLVLDAPGTFSVFISAEAINAILAGADNVKVAIPDLAGTTLHVKKIRTAFKFGYPSLSLESTASRVDLGMDLDVVAVARLEADIDPKSPTKMLLRVHLESIVPRAKWGIFDFKIRGFVRDLIHTTVDEKLRTLGVIEMPVTMNLPLKMPARQASVKLTGATGILSTPDLSLEVRAMVTRVLTLPDGLHILGRVDV